jgi:hypothetical protein
VRRADHDDVAAGFVPCGLGFAREAGGAGFAPVAVFEEQGLGLVQRSEALLAQLPAAFDDRHDERRSVQPRVREDVQLAHARVLFVA